MQVYCGHKLDSLLNPFPHADTDGTEDGVVADNKKYNLERC